MIGAVQNIRQSLFATLERSGCTLFPKDRWSFPT
jgi:hypothetical protein